MSFNKFASNVIEKCLSFGSNYQVQAIIEEFVAEKNSGKLIKLMRDVYAN